MFKLPFRVIQVISLAAGLIAACQPVNLPAQSTPAPAGGGTAPAAGAPTATQAAVPTATPDYLSQVCPRPGPDQAQYLSAEQGVCFLYPADFKPQPYFTRPADGVTLTGPSEIMGQEGIVATVSVLYNGPAFDLDSAAYAQKWLKLYFPGERPTPAAITIGGQPADLVNNYNEGMASQQVGLVVAGGYKYQVSAWPQPADSPKLGPAVQRAWELVTTSLKFFPPVNRAPAVRANEVCPAPGDNTQLWVNETAGFCVLYPADYRIDPDSNNRIVGGPVLADTADWGQVQTSITIAGYDQPPTALDQALTPPTEQIDPASVQKTTIGGVRAIIYDFTGGPWRQRTASLAARGSLYTLVGPYDEQHFPGSTAEAAKLWTTVTGSLTFFDRWR